MAVGPEQGDMLAGLEGAWCGVIEVGQGDFSRRLT
jgi:hypothetical protein